MILLCTMAVCILEIRNTNKLLGLFWKEKCFKPKQKLEQKEHYRTHKTLNIKVVHIQFKSFLANF